jgi:signal transduction histidine kinase
MLSFNVEDIIALPQLKDGKFTKNLRNIDIRAATEEVLSIQEQSAFDKGILLESCFEGFPEELDVPRFNLNMDEKRFQQVLLNFQSNSIKFVDKDESRVLIVVQLLASTQNRTQPPNAQFQFLLTKIHEFFGNHHLVETEPSLENPRQIDPKFSAMMEPSRSDDYLVVTVLDNGVGIAKENHHKLFQLFGCLSSTRKSNTNGVGLGLVISKMISQEFGGSAQFFSEAHVGSIF